MRLETSHRRAANAPDGAVFRPALLADWDDVTFVHFTLDPSVLQPHVPYPLDVFEDAAYVSLVAFTQRNLRPRFGGRLLETLSAPLASHEFLNVRTYVRHRDQQAIYFLSEWIPNRLATWLGPPLYGLPYRLGRLKYEYDRPSGRCALRVTANGRRLAFDAVFDATMPPEPAGADTLDRFLIERYTAFTVCRGEQTCFRVSHAPWVLYRADVRIDGWDLLKTVAVNWESAGLVAAHHSPGVKDVGLGPPTRIGSSGRGDR